jgi:hypothetical protein
MTMELWELVARESARDLIARYNANGDSGRIDQMLDVFAPNAVFESLGERYEGRDAIHAFFSGITRGERGAAERRPDSPAMAEWKAQGRPFMLRHITGTTQIDVIDRETVRARSYYFVITVHGLDHWGRYLDEFGLVDGEWRIVHRREITDAVFDGGWAAQGGGELMNAIVTHSIDWNGPE